MNGIRHPQIFGVPPKPKCDVILVPSDRDPVFAVKTEGFVNARAILKIYVVVAIGAIRTYFQIRKVGSCALDFAP